MSETTASAAKFARTENVNVSRDPARSPDRIGVIYVAEIDFRNGGRGWKVGHAVDLARRAYEHSRWESPGFVLVAAAPGTRREELALHCALHGVPTRRAPGEVYPDSDAFRAWLAAGFTAAWRGRVECAVPNGRARRLPWVALLRDVQRDVLRTVTADTAGDGA